MAWTRKRLKRGGVARIYQMIMTFNNTKSEHTQVADLPRTRLNVKGEGLPDLLLPSFECSTCAPWYQEIKPSVNAFRVAAARVEHSSLRNMLSMCVRTVLGLMSSSRATCLLLAPRLISRST